MMAAQESGLKGLSRANIDIGFIPGLLVDDG